MKKNDDEGDILSSSVDSELDCNNCMADVNDLFCDKHTFLPCIESEVGEILSYEREDGIF